MASQSEIIYYDYDLTILEELKVCLKLILEHTVMSLKMRMSSKNIKRILEMPELYDFLKMQKGLQGIFDFLEEREEQPISFYFIGYNSEYCDNNLEKSMRKNVFIKCDEEETDSEITSIAMIAEHNTTYVVIKPG